MPCPPELASILAQILQYGLVRIRAYGWEKDADRCALEADHLHNLPMLLSDFKAEMLDYYWNVERPCYLEKANPESATPYQPLWDELATHLTGLQSATSNSR
jgi:hypothetical protein